MGQIRRWLTLAAVLGLLAILAVVLYLILEPLHRDDGDGARATSQVGDTAPIAVVSPVSAYTASNHAESSASAIRSARTAQIVSQRIAAGAGVMSKSGLATAMNATIPV